MICLACNKPTFDGLTHPRCRGRYVIDGAFAAIAYKGVVRKLIYSFKYKPYLSNLKNSLVELFYESLIQQEMFVATMKQLNSEKIALVPIPLHRSRLKKRGYNHAEILAKGLSLSLKLPVINILAREKPTKSQFGLKLKERKENIRDAFSMVPNIPIALPASARRWQAGQFSNILLVDDILTSGTTFLEAAKILKKNGAKRVWGLALARD